MPKIRITSEFYSPIIRAVVALIVAGIVWAIVLNLPMFEAIRIPQLPPAVSEEDLVGTVFLLIMAAILFNFASEFGRQLRIALPQFPESSTILSCLIYTIIAVMSYNALLPWGEAVFKENVWVYQLIFLLLVIVPLGIGGFTIYRGVDKISALIGGRPAVAAGKMITCPQCGAANDPDAEFCTNCGAKLVKPEKPQVVVCPECGAENEPGAKFCVQCGAELPQSES